MALLCSSRAGSVYVAVSRNFIVHWDWGRTIGVCSYYVWKQQYVFHLEAHLIGSSGIQTPRPLDCEANALPSELPCLGFSKLFLFYNIRDHSEMMLSKEGDRGEGWSFCDTST